MKIRFFPMLSVAVSALFLGTAIAQTPRTIRWSETDPNSTQSFRDKKVFKEITDQIENVRVEASIEEVLDYYAVQLKIDNQGQRNLEIRPRSMRFLLVGPSTGDLRNIPPYAVEDRRRNESEAEANRREILGQSATKTTSKTEVEHVHVIPGVDPVGGDASAVVLTKTDTVAVVQRTKTETVPDEDVRSRSRTDAAEIRRQGQLEANRIRARALKDDAIGPRSSHSGEVYFYGTKTTGDLLLRIPFNDLIIEFPFKATRKKGLKVFQGPLKIE